MFDFIVAVFSFVGKKMCDNIYNKITTYAKDLVKTGVEIEQQFGIPIINKRISVTPISNLGEALKNPTIDDCLDIP